MWEGKDEVLCPQALEVRQDLRSVLGPLLGLGQDGRSVLGLGQDGRSMLGLGQDGRSVLGLGQDGRSVLGLGQDGRRLQARHLSVRAWVTASQGGGRWSSASTAGGDGAQSNDHPAHNHSNVGYVALDGGWHSHTCKYLVEINI